MGFYLRSSLHPQPWPVPFHRILLAWLDAGLDPVRCREVIERELAGGLPEGLLDPAAVTSGGTVATERLLRGSQRDAPWTWCFGTPSGPRAIDLPLDDVSTLAELVRIAARAATRDDALAEVAEYVDDTTFRAVFASCLADSDRHGTWRQVSRPGIYRREHASLVVRSSGGATIVTDPKRCATDWTTHFGDYPAEPAWGMAPSVLITHSHEDHFDLTSIVSCLPANLVVPRVPAPSLLAEDMAQLLADVGQPAIAPAWWTTVQLGDIPVTVLPFYGEQPTRDLVGPEGVRNWGSCYRLLVDGWSVAILVDSGRDPAGDVVDVLARSVREQGPIDILLSCCFPFPEMLNPGLAHYAFTVPFDALRSQHARGLESITSGPEGIARACEAARARYFLPYSHGFNGLHRDPASSSREADGSEHEVMRHVRAELAHRGVPTTALDWSPGESVHWTSGTLVIER